MLAISDIFVLPSAYREGIPRVLLEAASMALPVVTTDSPGCNEVVSHGENGFLVPTSNSSALRCAIQTLIDKPALRASFGRVSRQRALERFDLRVIADQIRNIYDELLAKKGLDFDKNSARIRNPGTALPKDAGLLHATLGGYR